MQTFSNLKQTPFPPFFVPSKSSQTPVFCKACFRLLCDTYPLFSLLQEVIGGFLALRMAGGARAQALAGLRLGHIPSGSTDSVAYSINGTRSQATAALHIALGDRWEVLLFIFPWGLRGSWTQIALCCVEAPLRTDALGFMFVKLSLSKLSFFLPCLDVASVLYAAKSKPFA